MNRNCIYAWSFKKSFLNFKFNDLKKNSDNLEAVTSSLFIILSVRRYQNEFIKLVHLMFLFFNV